MSNSSPRRKTGPAGLTLIRSFEKLRKTAYKPTPDDVWTIGWGHTKGVKPGDICTLAEAEQYLEEDCFDAETAVHRTVVVAINENQFDALVALAINIGTSAFRQSTLLRKLNTGDYKGASKQFDQWVYQHGNRLDGLAARRAAERTLFDTAPAPTVTII